MHVQAAALRAVSREGQCCRKEKKAEVAKVARELTPHPISPRLQVPSHIRKPPYVDTGEMPWGKDQEIHTPEVLPDVALLQYWKSSVEERGRRGGE